MILTLSANNYRDTLGHVPPDGQWHFVAVVLNQASTTPSIQFYVDTGPTATATPVPGNLANTHDLWVAASPLGGNQPWLGDLDEVEVYDRALANSELAAIYNAGVAGKCKPPCTGITVICPTNKTVPCGSVWTFDPPTAPTCCTNLIARDRHPDQPAHHPDRHRDQRRLPADHHPDLADYRRLRRHQHLQPDGNGGGYHAARHHCPTNTVVVALNTNCQLVIPYVSATATDNCTPACQLVYSQSPPAGTICLPGTCRLCHRDCDRPLRQFELVLWFWSRVSLKPGRW